MKILLISVGKTSYAPFKEAIAKYTSRLPHYVPFELKELPDIKNTRSLSETQQKELEGSVILENILPGDHIVLLDERGKEITSKELSKFISDKMISLPGRLVFIIGGPYGFSAPVYQRANEKISLSKMTLPHEMAKLVISEQLYRAMTILRGEPYHHD